MGDDVKLLLDADWCPKCEKGTLTASLNALVADSA